MPCFRASFIFAFGLLPRPCIRPFFIFASEGNREGRFRAAQPKATNYSILILNWLTTNFVAAPAVPAVVKPIANFAGGSELKLIAETGGVVAVPALNVAPEEPCAEPSSTCEIWSPSRTAQIDHGSVKPAAAVPVYAQVPAEVVKSGLVVTVASEA